MKILHVILCLNEEWGGPPRALANLAKTQAQRGDDVAVFPCQQSSRPQTLYPGRDGNLLVHEPATNSKLFWPNSKLKRMLSQAARDRNIVHIHGTWRYHLIAAAAAARKYGIPYIVRPAGNLGEMTRRHKAFLKFPYFLLLEKGIFNRAAAIHCCSHKERQELADLNLRARCFTVPQPIGSDLPNIQPDFEQLRSRCPHLKDNHRVVLFLGRFSAIKRLEVLLEAFIRLAPAFPDWHLILAGPHGEMNIVRHLEQRVNETGLSDRVSMPGLVIDGFKMACLTRADVFAQPSAHENFGLSVAEALAFGLPCVVSNGVALSENIDEAGAGIVCESSVDAFESCLRTMFNDEPARRRYSSAARKLSDRFAPMHVAEQLDREYQKCLNRG